MILGKQVFSMVLFGGFFSDFFELKGVAVTWLTIFICEVRCSETSKVDDFCRLIYGMRKCLLIFCDDFLL